MKLLVQYYRKMRDTTSSGMGSSAPGSLFGGRSAWRVTIRQLESMVRLSEALAKLYCVDEVSSRLKFKLTYIELYFVHVRILYYKIGCFGFLLEYYSNNDEFLSIMYPTVLYLRSKKPTSRKLFAC